MNPRIAILTASSLIFCTGNAMNPQDKKVGTKEDKKLAKALALLPAENNPVNDTVRPISAATSPSLSPNIDQELTKLMNELYRDQHFERLANLKKQKRKNF